MGGADFYKHYEATLLAIENAVEAAVNEGDVEMDYETVNDILTLTCADDSTIIITPQSATSQLWLAARSGGFHFDLANGRWTCKTDGELLADKLAAICSAQGGLDVVFEGI